MLNLLDCLVEACENEFLKLSRLDNQIYYKKSDYMGSIALRSQLRKCG